MNKIALCVAGILTVSSIVAPAAYAASDSKTSGAASGSNAMPNGATDTKSSRSSSQSPSPGAASVGAPGTAGKPGAESDPGTVKAPGSK